MKFQRGDLILSQSGTIIVMIIGVSESRYEIYVNYYRPIQGDVPGVFCDAEIEYTDNNHSLLTDIFRGEI